VLLRTSISLFLLFLVAACAALGACKPAPAVCPMGIASSLVDSAAQFDLQVFEAPISCDSITDATKPSYQTRTQSRELTIQVPDGRWILLVTALDAAGNPLGTGCTAVRVSESVAFCIPLVVEPFDGGADATTDLAGDGAACGPRDNGAGGTYMGCNPPGTHTQSDATKACQSRFPNEDCERESCSNGAAAVCPKDGTCLCWQFSGATATQCGSCTMISSWE